MPIPHRALLLWACNDKQHAAWEDADLMEGLPQARVAI